MIRAAKHKVIRAPEHKGNLIVSSESVEQGLERLQRYLRLVNPSVGLSVRRERSAVRLVVERAQTPFFTELTLSLCGIRFMRETDDQFSAAHVSFTHGPDPSTALLAMARARTAGRTTSFEFIEGTAETIPLPDRPARTGVSLSGRAAPHWLHGRTETHDVHL